MSSPMTFRGELCFRNAEELERARAIIEDGETAIGPSAVRVEHLMLVVDADTVAPAALWGHTRQALRRGAEVAWSGQVECAYFEGDDAVERDTVVAYGHMRAALPPAEKTRWTRRLRRWLTGARETAPSEEPQLPRCVESARWREQSADLLADYPPPSDYRFEFSDCSVLVCYQLVTARDEPNAETPCFVCGTMPDDIFSPDTAPYLTQVPIEELEVTTNRALARSAADAGVSGTLEELLAWAHQTCAAHFACQLEPPPLAGSGTAHALGTEAELRQDETSDEQDDGDGQAAEDEPWPTEGGRCICPACGSADTKSQYTKALGVRYIEASCAACNHYGMWVDRGVFFTKEAAEKQADHAVEAHPPEPDWIEVPGGVVRMGLTEDQARRLAETSADAARQRAEDGPSLSHGLREAAELEEFGGNPDYLYRLLTAALPVHEVVVARFAIARAPVTNAEYLAFMQETGAEPPEDWKLRKEDEMSQPVIGVSHAQAEAFAAWAGAALPTEAQWERAARGEESRLFPWGDSYGDAGAWLEARPNYNKRWVSTEQPMLASPEGCLDMVTRHWEWCADELRPYPRASAAALAELYPGCKVGGRSRRGGQGSHIVACCVARSGADPTSKAWYTGFRLVRRA